MDVSYNVLVFAMMIAHHYTGFTDGYWDMKQVRVIQNARAMPGVCL